MRAFLLQFFGVIIFLSNFELSGSSNAEHQIKKRQSMLEDNASFEMMDSEVMINEEREERGSKKSSAKKSKSSTTPAASGSHGTEATPIANQPTSEKPTGSMKKSKSSSKKSKPSARKSKSSTAAAASGSQGTEAKPIADQSTSEQPIGSMKKSKSSSKKSKSKPSGKKSKSSTAAAASGSQGTEATPVIDQQTGQTNTTVVAASASGVASPTEAASSNMTAGSSIAITDFSDTPYPIAASSDLAVDASNMTADIPVEKTDLIDTPYPNGASSDLYEAGAADLPIEAGNTSAVADSFAAVDTSAVADSSSVVALIGGTEMGSNVGAFANSPAENLEMQEAQAISNAIGGINNATDQIVNTTAALGKATIVIDNATIAVGNFAAALTIATDDVQSHDWQKEKQSDSSNLKETTKNPINTLDRILMAVENETNLEHPTNLEPEEKEPTTWERILQAASENVSSSETIGQNNSNENDFEDVLNVNGSVSDDTTEKPSSETPIPNEDVPTPVATAAEGGHVIPTDTIMEEPPQSGTSLPIEENTAPQQNNLQDNLNRDKTIDLILADSVPETAQATELENQTQSAPETGPAPAVSNYEVQATELENPTHSVQEAGPAPVLSNYAVQAAQESGPAASNNEFQAGKGWQSQSGIRGSVGHLGLGMDDTVDQIEEHLKGGLALDKSRVSSYDILLRQNHPHFGENGNHDVHEGYEYETYKNARKKGRYPVSNNEGERKYAYQYFQESLQPEVPQPQPGDSSYVALNYPVDSQSQYSGGSSFSAPQETASQDGETNTGGNSRSAREEKIDYTEQSLEEEEEGDITESGEEESSGSNERNLDMETVGDGDDQYDDENLSPEGNLNYEAEAEDSEENSGSNDVSEEDDG